MSTPMTFKSRTQVKPPEKGSFPLDHHAECKKFMFLYMTCLRRNGQENTKCREEAKNYLGCRMERFRYVGEPLNHEAWEWYNDVVGEGRCDVVDTWWQTETGGIAIAPRPSEPGAKIVPAMPMRPFFGIQPVLAGLVTSGLPKTRSGKIMRRILRKVALNQFEELGDISTLADPSEVEAIIKNHVARTTSKKPAS